CHRDRAGLDGTRAARPGESDRGNRRGRIARPRGNLPGAQSMKAVLRLVFAYFWGTRFRRIFAALGLALCACAFVELVRPPYAESMLAVAWAGIVSLFVGTGLMPLMLGRMARSRAMPLTLLGSTYLGLMITRGLRVFEAGLAVALMLALMAVAVIAARPGTDPTVVIALELILA